MAFIRGFARQKTDKLGNFWVDLVRALLWVLLPIALVGALVLVWQGVPMNFHPYTQATTVEGRDGRPSRKGRSPPWKSSRISAPMAVGSSTRTGLIPTRTRPR